MRVLVTGGTGFVGLAVLDALVGGGHETVGTGRGAHGRGRLAADLEQPGVFERMLTQVRPDAVVHCAALADIAPCRDDPVRARRLNADLPGDVARACCVHELRLVHVSTDQVFDGSRGGWSEEDEPRPLHVYGRTKQVAERAVLGACPAAVVVRPGLVTGTAPDGRRSSSSALHAALKRGDRPVMFTDEIRSPVAVTHLARALAELVERDDVHGLLHCGGPEALSRHELACREAVAAGFDPDRIASGTRAGAGLDAERPADLSLDSARLVALLGWTPATLA